MENVVLLWYHNSADNDIPSTLIVNQIQERSFTQEHCILTVQRFTTMHKLRGFHSKEENLFSTMDLNIID
ncbi:unnamed protein product [Adineta ricciae]|uniref:Uncharacterized protein n=1 Tax=Adineta ricciae TaxID=249248 RepID=A0A815GY84_ADIRI|nr:unnamed protein product [Adineta ricciae]